MYTPSQSKDHENMISYQWKYFKRDQQFSLRIWKLQKCPIKNYVHLLLSDQGSHAKIWVSKSQYFDDEYPPPILFKGSKQITYSN